MSTDSTNDGSGEMPLAFKRVLADEQKLLDIDHSHSPNGIALSGGGIRSATFCLGVLQRLIDSGRLAKFHYLSTVSGGGYAGAWLLGMLDRIGRDLHDKPEHVRAAIRHLRRYSNYLTPRRGLTGIDTLSGVVTYLRNLFLNALLIVPVLCAILLLPGVLSHFSEWVVAMSKSVSKPWTYLAAFWAPGLLFLFGAVWVGVLGPRKFKPEESWIRDPGRAPLLLGGPMFLGTLLLSHALVTLAGIDVTTLDRVDISTPGGVYVSTLGGVDVKQHLPIRPWWHFALGGAVAYLLISLVAFLSWRLKVGSTNWRAWQLDDREGGRTAWVANIFGPLVAGLGGGILLWLIYRGGFRALDPVTSPWPQLRDLLTEPYAHTIVSLLATPVVGFSLFAAMALHLAVCHGALSEHDREWASRWGAFTLSWLGLWIVGCVLAFLVPSLVHAAPGWLQGAGLTAWAGFSALTGFLARALGQEEKGAGPMAKRAVLAVGPYLFVIGLLVAVALLDHAVLRLFGLWFPIAAQGAAAACDVAAATWAGLLEHLRCDLWSWAFGEPHYLSGWGALGLAAAAIAFSVILGFAVDVNLFSLHRFYRHRLARCYLGASRFANVQDPDDPVGGCTGWLQAGGRKPHPLTDLDPDDDLLLARLSGIRPYPIINAALNLVSSHERAWQQRKAASFTFTPLYCGFQIPPAKDDSVTSIEPGAGTSPLTPVAGGFRPTSKYLYPLTSTADREYGLKLSVPVAISGAAFTSNAGVHTKPWMTFLLTVFGIRLGRWCGNPDPRERSYGSGWLDSAWLGLRKRVARRATWNREGPLNAFALLAAEMLGKTHEAATYVYLGDGGHFENLGIYELVRRRCMLILAVDASADPGYVFDDLANAVEKCRVDLDVAIEFKADDLARLSPDPATKRSQAHFAVGRIRYPSVAEEGRIIYLKTTVTGDEPADVLHYAREHPRFPHETTLDQWFDELQFESYRKLGYHAAKSLYPWSGDPI